MTKAKEGDKVTVHYSGTLDDGTIFDTTDGRDPLEYVIGGQTLLPMFEMAAVGKSVGDKYTVKIPMEEAYGDRRQDLFKMVPLSLMSDGQEPQIGMNVEMHTSDGDVLTGRIVMIVDDQMQINANHILAGFDLTFSFELLAINGEGAIEA